MKGMEYHMPECGQNRTETVRYFLGIDGGGTKTALLLLDRAGNSVGQVYTDACNPMDIGFDRCFDILRGAIEQICGDIPLSCVGMFAGIAGGGSASSRERLSRFFADFGFGIYDNDGDNRSILEAGLGARDGISVIMGTGILVQARCGGKLHRVGGWGYFVDRGGSGFNLGRDALDAYYSAYDGSGEATLLTGLIEEKTRCTPDALIPEIYAGGKSFVASFAPLVTQACRRGDSVADAILCRNVDCAARVITAAEQHMPAELQDIPVVLCGGLSHDAEIVSRLERRLAAHGRLKIECLSREPVWGAAMTARKLALTEK